MVPGHRLTFLVVRHNCRSQLETGSGHPERLAIVVLAFVAEKRSAHSARQWANPIEQQPQVSVDGKHRLQSTPLGRHQPKRQATVSGSALLPGARELAPGSEAGVCTNQGGGHGGRRRDRAGDYAHRVCSHWGARKKQAPFGPCSEEGLHPRCLPCLAAEAASLLRPARLQVGQVRDISR